MMENGPTSSRAKYMLVVVFLSLAGLFAAWVWNSELTELGGDSAGYLLMARYYSPFHAASAATVAYKSQIITPPLFSWLLAMVDGGNNLIAAHLVVAFFAVASAAILCIWLRRESLPILLCAVVAIIFAIMPSTLFQVFNIWTEFPYIFFSLAATALLTHAEQSSSSSTWFGAAVMVACASLIRAASLPLLVAFLVFLVYKHPRKLLPIGLIAFVPFVIWAVYSSYTESGASGGGSNYIKQMLDAYASNPLDRLAQQLRGEYKAILAAWKSAWLGATLSVSLTKFIWGFGLICICGWLFRLKSLRFDAIYVSLYLVMLFVWPHPEEALRYSFVLYPVFIAQGFLLISMMSRRIPDLRGHSLALGVMAGTLIISLLPMLTYNVKRFFDEVPEDLAAVKHRSEWYNEDSMQAFYQENFQLRLFDQFREANRIVLPQDCIFSIKPTIVTFISDRMSYTPPKTTVDEKQFNAEIKKCRFAYVMPFTSPSFGVSSYPMARLGDRAKILTKLDDGQAQMESGLIEITP